MWVRMRTTSATAEGVALPGSVVQVDDRVGEGLVAGGYAEEVKRKLERPAPVVEEARVEEDAEARPAPRRRRRRKAKE